MNQLEHDEIWEDGEGPSRPWMVAYTFWLKVTGDERFSLVPLEDLVTPRSLPTWEAELDDLPSFFEGYAIASRTRYLSPIWTKILFPVWSDDDGDEPKLITEPTEVIAMGAYVEYIDAISDWRLHAVGAPNLDEDPGLEHLSAEPGGPFSPH